MKAVYGPQKPLLMFGENMHYITEVMIAAFILLSALVFVYQVQGSESIDIRDKIQACLMYVDASGGLRTSSVQYNAAAVKTAMQSCLPDVINISVSINSMCSGPQDKNVQKYAYFIYGDGHIIAPTMIDVCGWII